MEKTKNFGFFDYGFLGDDLEESVEFVRRDIKSLFYDLSLPQGILLKNVELDIDTSVFKEGNFLLLKTSEGIKEFKIIKAVDDSLIIQDSFYTFGLPFDLLLNLDYDVIIKKRFSEFNVSDMVHIIDNVANVETYALVTGVSNESLSVILLDDKDSGCFDGRVITLNNKCSCTITKVN